MAKLSLCQFPCQSAMCPLCPLGSFSGSPWFPLSSLPLLLSLPLTPLRAHQEGRTHVRREGRSKSRVFWGKEGQELGCFPLCPHPDPQLGKQVCQQMVASAAEGRGHLPCWLVGCGLTKKGLFFLFETSLKRLLPRLASDIWQSSCLNQALRLRLEPLRSLTHRV